MTKDFTQAEKQLIQEIKSAKLDKGTGVALCVLCGKKDEHAIAMAEFIRNHQNEDVDAYIDKAYEIIGEPRPIYVVSYDDE